MLTAAQLHLDDRHRGCRRWRRGKSGLPDLSETVEVHSQLELAVRVTAHVDDQNLDGRMQVVGAAVSVLHYDFVVSL